MYIVNQKGNYMLHLKKTWNLNIKKVLLWSCLLPTCTGMQLCIGGNVISDLIIEPNYDSIRMKV